MSASSAQKSSNCSAPLFRMRSWAISPPVAPQSRKRSGRTSEEVHVGDKYSRLDGPGISSNSSKSTQANISLENRPRFANRPRYQPQLKYPVAIFVQLVWQDHSKDKEEKSRETPVERRIGNYPVAAIALQLLCCFLEPVKLIPDGYKKNRVLAECESSSFAGGSTVQVRRSEFPIALCCCR